MRWRQRETRKKEKGQENWLPVIQKEKCMLSLSGNIPFFVSGLEENAFLIVNFSQFPF